LLPRRGRLGRSDGRNGGKHSVGGSKRRCGGMPSLPSRAELEAAPPYWRGGCPRRVGQRFESPQLHQEVGANRPGFPAPTVAFDQQDRSAETRHAEANRGCGDGWSLNGLHRNHADRLRKRERSRPGRRRTRTCAPSRLSSRLRIMGPFLHAVAISPSRSFASTGEPITEPREGRREKRRKVEGFRVFHAQPSIANSPPSKASRNKLRRATSGLMDRERKWSLRAL
jgi:hypothetical protein